MYILYVTNNSLQSVKNSFLFVVPIFPTIMLKASKALKEKSLRLKILYAFTNYFSKMIYLSTSYLCLCCVISQSNFQTNMEI